MSFAHIPGEAHSDPRLFAAGMAAVGVRDLCWAYSSQHRTGGFVRSDYVRSLPGRAVAAARKAGLLEAVVQGEVRHVEGRIKIGGKPASDVEVIAPWDGYWLPEYLLYHRSADEWCGRSEQQRRNARSGLDPDPPDTDHQPTAQPMAQPMAQPTAEPTSGSNPSQWLGRSTSTSKEEQDLALTSESDVDAFRVPGDVTMPDGWEDAVRDRYRDGATLDEILSDFPPLTVGDLEWALGIGMYAPGYTERLIALVTDAPEATSTGTGHPSAASASADLNGDVERAGPARERSR